LKWISKSRKVAEVGAQTRRVDNWEVLHVLETELVSYETRATIIFPLLVLGFVTLWTQLFTFEEAVPRSLAWIAWSIFLVAIVLAAQLIRPRRLTGHLVRSERDERDKLADLGREVEARIGELARGLDRCIALALAFAVLAYLIDKTFYPP
jgi:hypothetical protein